MGTDHEAPAAALDARLVWDVCHLTPSEIGVTITLSIKPIDFVGIMQQQHVGFGPQQCGCQLTCASD